MGRTAKCSCLLVALAAFLTTTLAEATMAADKFGGHLYVTYQNSDNSGIRREYLSERFEATLRDRVFERNDLAFTFYFDNARDLSSHQTVRRYRGMLNLQNPYYTFNARYTPRQDVTALESPTTVEILDKQALLDIHPPDLPRLRLFYGETERFTQGVWGNRATDLRGDLFYTYSLFSLALNRYHSISENSLKRTTDMTGVDVRAAHSYGPRFGFDAGYRYQLTETERSQGSRRDVTNNTLQGNFTSQYRRLLLANATLNRRYLTSENGVRFESVDDNDRVSALIMPFSPVNLELSDTYVRSDQDTYVSQTHYASAQVIADGTVWKQTRGLLQMTRQFDINTFNSIVPDHIYFVRLESFNRRGIDIRAEAGVNERVRDIGRAYRYRNSTTLNVYLRPRHNITLVPRIYHNKYSDNISFTGNDQATYGLTGTWTARYLNFGAQLTHSAINTGRQSRSNAAVVNMSARLRSRASFNVSYGVRETDQFAASLQPWNYDKARTLNIWGQLWVLPRGSVSVNYTRVERERAGDTNYLALNYRQDF